VAAMVRKRLGVVVTGVLAVVLGSGQAAVAEPTLQVSVSGARLAAGGSQVVVSGKYVCGPFAEGDGVVDLTVTQGGTTGYGYVYPSACDGAAQPWSAVVDSVNTPFVAGRARVIGGGYVCDRVTGACVFGSFGPTTVRVR
jgi:hypothetical protein